MSEQTGFDGHTTHYTCDAGYDAIQVIEDFHLNREQETHGLNPVGGMRTI